MTWWLWLLIYFAGLPLGLGMATAYEDPATAPAVAFAVLTWPLAVLFFLGARLTS